MTTAFTLRQLEYFDAIASEGSLAAAAARCHVSATGLGLALDELERHLTVQLFVRRKGRGVTLAPEGARLLPHIRQLLAGAESLVAAAAQSASGLVGNFSIGCFPTLTPFFLPGVMESFRRDHPHVELEFVEGTAPELHELLLQGRLDAALLYRVDVPAQFVFEAIREHRPHVIVAKDHRLAGRGIVALAELVTEPLIQLDLRPSQQNTEHIFASLGLRPATRHTTTNYELARSLVGRGLGYSVLIQRPASNVTYDGHRLATLELSDRIAPTIAGLARPHGAPPTAKYLALRDLLRGTPRTP
jgi:DNA-binding transcriptional LysR family regulator